MTAGHLAAQDAVVVEVENKVDSAKATGAWFPAKQGLSLAYKDRVRTGEKSRAVVRFTNLTTLRLDELTKITLVPPVSESAKPQLDLSNGAIYLFSRDKPRELEVRTPAANAGLRGTQLIVRVTPAAKTLLTVLEGEVDLSNAQGKVLLKSGESGEAEVGQAPRKTAVLEAKNILQWALYYPGVLDPEELGLNEREGGAVAASLEAYRAGDLLGALEKYPQGRAPGSEAGRLYRAGVLLAVGRVDEAVAAMKGLPANSPGKRALEQMIAAVKFEDWSRDGEPSDGGRVDGRVLLRAVEEPAGDRARRRSQGGGSAARFRLRVGAHRGARV